ncbi:hypothetical protein F3Y22_tig00116937pilonHSYRG00101 [Hibiscus syriacus]|uniref:Mitochondrial transcription termination factor family protein n=1 Tax=Hibiscus syriacus TaxID=106335 RepID=A0A6A2WNK8_HIBSY|nr:hypothetical protein F3Y22_tig00116937pilonHSYRG00101 [Hibiscus syriacus]
MNSSALLRWQKLLKIIKNSYFLHQCCPKHKTLQNPYTQTQNPFGFLVASEYSTQPTKFPEYQMPSVTWGVVQGRKEKLVNRVKICDYLKTLGIIPDELENLELPSTVEVMCERVQFLQKLGLTIDDINEYPLMLGCSVRKNMVPVLGYLEKIGIPKSN